MSVVGRHSVFLQVYPWGNEGRGWDSHVNVKCFALVWNFERQSDADYVLG